MAASESHCESMPAENEKSAMELRYPTEDGHEQEIASTQEKAGRKLGQESGSCGIKCLSKPPSATKHPSLPYGQLFAKSINVVEPELGVPYYGQSHPWYAPNVDGLLNQFPSLENIHIYDIYGKEAYEDERDWYEQKGHEFLNVILAHPSNSNVSLTIDAGEDSELVAKMRNRAEIFDRIWAYP